MLEKLIRLEAGYFHTPVVHLANADGRLMTLIGAMHMGCVFYYDEVQLLLDAAERQGYAVMHEGTDWSNVLSTGFPPLSAEQYHRYWPHMEKMHAALLSFGITEQAFALRPRKTWVFTDPYHEQVSQELFGDLDFERVIEKAEEAAQNPLQLLKGLRVHFAKIAAGESGGEPAPFTAERDKEAARAMLDARRNAISCWGVRHLPGIIGHLEQAGFAIEDVEWLPCFPESLPNVKPAE